MEEFTHSILHFLHNVHDSPIGKGGVVSGHQLLQLSDKLSQTWTISEKLDLLKNWHCLGPHRLPRQSVPLLKYLYS